LKRDIENDLSSTVLPVFWSFFDIIRFYDENIQNKHYRQKLEKIKLTKK